MAAPQPDTLSEILVTSALPYANGPLHVGHMLEYIQTDIWVRFQKLRNRRCYYVCADDAHGTPIMLKAQQLGIDPEELIEQMHKEHKRDFDKFLINFDAYHSTHSKENRHYANLIYKRLHDGGHITTRLVRQAYDEQHGMFLPDRFIKGDCPSCGAPDQYGDNCEVCGATYSPTELGNPKSVLSGVAPVERESEHYFFRLGNFTDHLQRWLKEESRVQPAIRNKVSEWLTEGLRDWDISRDAPYFGFEIPDAPDKYFYVWLDAPIGYMAAFQKLCDQNPELDFDHYWGADSPTSLLHVIGKDIAYFHTLFWPAMLDGAGMRTPTAVQCHGFLTINGQKMSKSRGTFVTAERYLQDLDPEYLRYYFAARLTMDIGDIDLNVEDFVTRVNSDLVGKLVNIASRCAGFIERHFDGYVLCDRAIAEHPLISSILSERDTIAKLYWRFEFAPAMRFIMAFADEANRFIDERKPWNIVKRDGATDELHRICSVGLVAFAHLALYLKPVLPELAEKTEKFMNISLAQWDTMEMNSPKHKCEPFTPMMQRIDLDTALKVFAPSSPEARPASPKPADPSAKPLIDYKDFAKLDLRVGEITQAEAVEGADKLLKLTVRIGDETRTVFAGIKTSYTPEQLTGRLVAVVANLKPKKMRFGASEAMVLAAGDDDIFLLSPDAGARPGMPVR